MSERSVISKDGSEISYEVTGRGRPLIVCDGIGCAGYAWKYFIPYFSNRFQIVHWNYRGHGKTPAPIDPSHVRMSDMRDDLEAIISKEKIKQPVLVGHSMGAQVILDYYLHHQDEVAALVPICGSSGRPLMTFHGNMLASLALPYLTSAMNRFPAVTRRLWTALTQSELTYQVAVHTEANGPFIHRPDFQPYFDDLRHVDPLLFMRMLAELNSHDVESRLSEVKAPTLIVAGEKDSFTPAWISRKMHDKISHSEFLLIAGGTHSAPIEFPDLINLRVEKFFADQSLFGPEARASGKRLRAI